VVTEFGVLCAAWIALLVFLARKGTKHFLAKHVPVTLPLVGGLCGALLEAVPTSPVSFGFTFRTSVAVLVGVFAGRLFVKIVRHWAEAHEKRIAASPAAAKKRLVHPLLAAGLLLAGPPVIWHLLTSELSLFEEHGTPRDAETGIVHGCEEIRVEKGAPAAALLLHDLYMSPAEWKDEAAKLEAAGFDVHAPLLPGHGRKPDDLDRVWAEDDRKFARAAYDALAAKHARVAVLGRGAGATLALLLAAEKKPAALVLVDPYLGRLSTPSWSPVSFDSLVGPASRAVRRTFTQENVLGRGYVVRALHALRQFRDLARGIDAAAKDVACPTLVVAGPDGTYPSAFALEWTASRLGDRAKTAPLDASAPDAETRFVVEAR
jgi:esterase/lipase